MPKKPKVIRNQATVIVATSQDAELNAAIASAVSGFGPSRPPAWDQMSDQDWCSIQTEFRLPNVTADGVDVRAYLEHLRVKLMDGLALKSHQVPLRSNQNELRALLKLQTGDLMPPIGHELARRLAGMGTLDLRFGERNTAKYRTVVSYVSTQERVTKLIRDWATWVAMFGAFQRSHNMLHGGSSSLAEVAAISELIHFTRDILQVADSNWVGVSTKEKRVIGCGRRARSAKRGGGSWLPSLSNPARRRWTTSVPSSSA